MTPGVHKDRGFGPYAPARCGECQAPATREPTTGAYSIKATDHRPDCKTGQDQLLARVHVRRDGAVHWRGPWRPSGEPWTWLVGFVARYPGARGRWHYVIAGRKGQSPLYGTRRAALLAMLRNPNTRPAKP